MGSLLLLLFLIFLFKNISFLVMGLFMVALMMSLCFSFFSSTWLGAIFFLIYIGAILVIFFYIFSISFKLSMSNKMFTFNWMVGLLILFFFFKKKPEILEESGVFNVFKEKMISKGDGLFFFFSLILFLSLWVSMKIHIFKKLALRVFF